MKKSILSIALVSFVMTLSSFTTPESKLTVKNNTTVGHAGSGSVGGNVKLDHAGSGSVGGNVKLD